MLVGFGSFAPKSMPAREGRNPRTGEKLQIQGAHAFGKAAPFPALPCSALSLRAHADDRPPRPSGPAACAARARAALRRAASRVPTFSVAKTFKERVNASKDS